jgi:hypothetical protein
MMDDSNDAKFLRNNSTRGEEQGGLWAGDAMNRDRYGRQTMSFMADDQIDGLEGDG